MAVGGDPFDGHHVHLAHATHSDQFLFHGSAAYQEHTGQPQGAAGLHQWMCELIHDPCRRYRLIRRCSVEQQRSLRGTGERSH